MKRSSTHYLLNALLRLFAASFNLRPGLRRYLHADTGPLEFSVGIRTESRSAEGGVIFAGGRVSARAVVPEAPDVVLVLADDEVIRRMLRITPNEVLTLLLKNRMRTEGNLSYLSLFNFYLSLVRPSGRRDRGVAPGRPPVGEGLANGHPRGSVDLESGRPRETTPRPAAAGSFLGRDAAAEERRRGGAKAARRPGLLEAKSIDPGVRFLDEPYLSRFKRGDFPRLERFVDIHLSTRPRVCLERASLVTRWHKEHGFETTRSGEPWHPVLRQGLMLRHLLSNKKPQVRSGDLIAGTTTTEEIGVVLYPDAQATLLWGELRALSDRELNPYDISEETIHALHHEILPYWTKRNFREWVRERHRDPLCQRLDERFAVYFSWKTVALSHTIPDFASILEVGAEGLIERCRNEIERRGDEAGAAVLEAMVASLEGLVAYATNLAGEARRQAKLATDSSRQAELEELAGICERVPRGPARSLAEALNAIWITWVGLHMESTNAGLSLGRLDWLLQPFFEKDMDRLSSPADKERYIASAIELAGCFFMRCTDHLPTIPDIGNYLFGGSSSDQAITLVGVTPEGGDAVCDMTYVLLKVTEILGIRDPNVNARYHPQRSSETYLRRLCEVNLMTRATPSMHNDLAVQESLSPLGYPEEHSRDWAATGCVEPTLCGRHMGHTNAMMMNLVAALEMALNDGTHPLMRWAVGPRTGSVEKGDFGSFDAFFDAFASQLRFLVGKAVEYNNLLGEAHARLRPTPLLSALIEGCVEAGLDATEGGARYNSSGAACIGLADVTDSLLAIDRLVFDEKKVSFERLAEAVASSFENDPDLQAMVRTKVPLFGSGDPRAVAMARKVARLTSETYAAHKNYRGGPYTAGFWSMSNHVAFGTLSGALPSGRPAGKAFTPGLTPQAFASKNLLDNLRDVAELEPRHMSNNMAFNVKVAPARHDGHERTVDTMTAYAKTYFDLGGMQMQMNVVSSAVLRDAMENPESYRDLLVRISGYNAYFVTLNRDMQLELIERAEFEVA